MISVHVMTDRMSVTFLGQKLITAIMTMVGEMVMVMVMMIMMMMMINWVREVDGTGLVCFTNSNAVLACQLC
jgi:hypothetical protein